MSMGIAALNPSYYVYGRDGQGAGSHHLTVDEARRIAVNIAKPPELLQRAKARDADLKSRPA